MKIIIHKKNNIEIIDCNAIDVISYKNKSLTILLHNKIIYDLKMPLVEYNSFVSEYREAYKLKKFEFIWDYCDGRCG